MNIVMYVKYHTNANDIELKRSLSGWFLKVAICGNNKGYHARLPKIDHLSPSHAKL